MFDEADILTNTKPAASGPCSTHAPPNVAVTSTWLPRGANCRPSLPNEAVSKLFPSTPIYNRQYELLYEEICASYPPVSPSKA